MAEQWRQLYRPGPISTVIFDSGGTLVRSSVPKRVTLYRMACDVVGADAAAMATAYSRAAACYDSLYLTVGHAAATEAACQVAWECLIGPGPEACRLAGIYRQNLTTDKVPYPDARPVLARLQTRYRLIVLSNAPDILACDYQRIGLDTHFNLILTSEQLGADKPDPTAYSRALAAAGVGAEHACMVGNDLSADVVGALQAGVRAVWLCRDGVRQGVLDPVPVVESLADLPRVLSELTGGETL